MLLPDPSLRFFGSTTIAHVDPNMTYTEFAVSIRGALVAAEVGAIHACPHLFDRILGVLFFCVLVFFHLLTLRFVYCYLCTHLLSCPDRLGVQHNRRVRAHALHRPGPDIGPSPAVCGAGRHDLDLAGGQGARGNSPRSLAPLWLHHSRTGEEDSAATWLCVFQKCRMTLLS
jgi:hypothetical protein